MQFPLLERDQSSRIKESKKPIKAHEGIKAHCSVLRVSGAWANITER